MHLLVASVADGDEVVEVFGIDALVGDVMHMQVLVVAAELAT
jgi:hypothetical protein